MTDALLPTRLPVAGRGRKGTSWTGFLCLIVTEASLFGYLLFSYFYCATQLDGGWSPEPHPSLALAAPNTAILLASSGAAAIAEHAVRKGRMGRYFAGVGATVLLGAVFVGVQMFEWKAKPFNLQSGPYAALYFITTGFHMAHVVLGLVIWLVMLLWAKLGYLDTRRNLPVQIASVYWHFVDAVWVAVFVTYYLSPYAG